MTGTNVLSMLREYQADRCAVCAGTDHLVVDHDHDTGLVRGLLCSGCNTSEGNKDRDSPELCAYRSHPPTAQLGIEIRYVKGRTQMPWPARPRRIRPPSPPSRGRMVDIDDLIDSAAVADIVGLSKSNNVATYRSRYADFPPPVVNLGSGRCLLWLRPEVEAWNEARRRRA